MSNQQSPPPTHLWLLIQQVTAHYIETDGRGKPGRPRKYPALSFLLLAVVAVTFRTFQGLELRRLLEKDSHLRSELGFEIVPHRRTIERRLDGLQPEAETQVAALGQRIVNEVEPTEGVPVASAIDARRYRARGPLWQQKAASTGHDSAPLAQC